MAFVALAALAFISARSAAHENDEEYAFVANRDSNDVAIISLRTNTVVDRFPAGLQPHQIVLGADGRTTYTTGAASNTLTVAYMAKALPGSPYRLGRGPEHLSLSPDARFLYIGNFDEGTVSVFDVPSKREVKRIEGFVKPHAITFIPGGTKAYISNFGAYDVNVIDVTTHTLVKKLHIAPPTRVASLSAPATVNGVVNVTLSADGGTAFAPAGDAGQVAVIDTRTDEVKEFIRVGRQPWQAYRMRGGKHMLTPNNGDRTVSVIDVERGEVVATLPGGTDMVGINPGRDDRYAFVIIRGENKVRVLDLVAMKTVRDIPVGRSPETASTTSDGKRLYVTTSGDGEVWVIDTASFEVSAVIRNVGKGSWGIAIANGFNYCH